MHTCRRKCITRPFNPPSIPSTLFYAQTPPTATTAEQLQLLVGQQQHPKGSPQHGTCANPVAQIMLHSNCAQLRNAHMQWCIKAPSSQKGQQMPLVVTCMPCIVEPSYSEHQRPTTASCACWHPCIVTPCLPTTRHHWHVQHCTRIPKHCICAHIQSSSTDNTPQSSWLPNVR
jgi:hypothetical protein